MDFRALDEQGWMLIPGLLASSAVGRDRHPDLETWDDLRRDPDVLAAAGHVLEAEAAVRDLHGRNPLPGYGLQGLHADWMPRSSVRPFFVVTAIWMLDDFRKDNGATRLVPGSHLLLGPIPRTFAQPHARHPREIVVTGAAGSVLVFNGHTWHSGRRNDRQEPRRAVQMVLQRASG